MKKSLGTILILAIMLISSYARAESKGYWLYLGSVDSEVTATSSTATPLVVGAGARYERSDGEYVISGLDGTDGFFNIQLDSYTCTDCDSGVTFTIKWKESDINDDTHWTAADYHSVPGLTGIALSGDIYQKYTFSPEKSDFMRFYLEPGADDFQNMKLRLKVK